MVVSVLMLLTGCLLIVQADSNIGHFELCWLCQQVCMLFWKLDLKH